MAELILLFINKYEFGQQACSAYYFKKKLFPFNLDALSNGFHADDDRYMFEEFLKSCNKHPSYVDEYDYENYVLKENTKYFVNYMRN